MSRTLRASALLLSLFVAACHKTPPDTMAEPPVSLDEPMPALVIADSIPEGVEITVLDPGQEPRQLLRFQAVAGQEEDLRMSMLMNMRMTMMGMPVEIAMPEMILVMHLQVQEVDADGNLHYSAEVSEVDVGDGDPEIVDVLRASMQDLVGLRGDVVMTPSGVALEAGFSAPEGATPSVIQQVESINQSAENMNTPMPNEPVGVGARWQVRKLSSANGLEVVEQSVFTVTSLEGGVVGLSTDVSQLLASATPKLEGMPEGTEVTVLSFSSSGQSTSTLRMDRLAPQASDAQVGLNMEMRISDGTGSQDMAVGMELGVKMGPKP